MRQYVQGYGQGIKTRESLRDLGRRRGVVGGDLLNEGEELAVEGDHHALLAQLARGRAHVLARARIRATLAPTLAQP